MKKEMVVAIAHEASPDMTWYAAIENPDQASPGELAFLIRFAALVEQYTHTNNKARWYQEGVEAEREACATDCAVYNEPAYPKGDCDCGGYTTPPASQRQWVGLTDEDLSVCDEDGVILARYWEAKLREKNT